MIQISTKIDSNGNTAILAIESISYESRLYERDFALVKEAVDNIKRKLEANKYYLITLNEKYIDNGNGHIEFEKFDVVNINEITIYENTKLNN